MRPVPEGCWLWAVVAETHLHARRHRAITEDDLKVKLYLPLNSTVTVQDGIVMKAASRNMSTV